jgi:hypothetical protein
MNHFLTWQQTQKNSTPPMPGSPTYKNQDYTPDFTPETCGYLG